MVYLVVRDEADRGVYYFESRSVAEDIANNLSSYVFMHEDEKKAAMDLIGAKEITDALFLIRKYRSKKNKKNAEKKAEVVEKQVESISTTKKESKTVTRATTYGERFSIIIRRLYDAGNECLKITMSSGDEYVIFLKSVFFTTEPNIHNRFMYPSGKNVEINTTVVDNAINTKKIGVLCKSKIEYVDDFAIISDCDDRYSPNVVSTNNNTEYRHMFDKIVINTERIESIVPVPTPDLGSYMIRNDILVKYLVKKML